MKLCIECQFVKKAYIQIGNTTGPTLLCTNEECRNPISGEAMSCDAVRPNDAFCGIKAKHYKQKEKVDTSQVKVIQLT